MKFEFPDTGEGVTEGQFLEWLVEEGEQIEEDQVVGEAETDKAVIDIPAPSDGKIKDLKAQPGDTVKVGDVIMVIDTGEDLEEEEPEAEKDNAVKTEEQETSQTDKESTAPESSGNVLALPKVRKLAEEKGVDLASIKVGERIREEEVLEAAGSEGNEEKVETVETDKEVKATPAVRRMAREKDIDIEKIEGSGRGGKITRNDVLDAVEAPVEKKTGYEDDGKEHRVEETDEEERLEMSKIRKSIASKMEKSRFTAPHVTHVEKADVTELVELREKEKDKFDAHLTYLPFMMKAVLEGLKQYPELNAELDEKNDEIVLKKSYDFNIAVDTERGLMVPVVGDVGEKSIVELAKSIEDAAEQAQNGEVTKKEMDKGTFSITNLGVIGGEEFTPIINYPQTAILGIGKIGETAEVIDGKVKPRTTVKLSLSYDHRVVDGADAARFMNTVVENLENPEEMLMRL